MLMFAFMLGHLGNEGWGKVPAPYEVRALVGLGLIELSEEEARSLDLAIASSEFWGEYGDYTAGVWVRPAHEPEAARLPIATPHHAWRPAVHTPGEPTPWVDDEVPF
jgi:hypothetical protein